MMKYEARLGKSGWTRLGKSGQVGWIPEILQSKASEARLGKFWQVLARLGKWADYQITWNPRLGKSRQVKWTDYQNAEIQVRLGKARQV